MGKIKNKKKMNEIEKNIEISKIKKGFFEKTNKIYRPLIRLCKKSRR